MNQAVRQTDVLRELTEEESSALKKCILDIFIAVTDVCKEHGLTYMLAGGSCLGAIRHKGFIPWDDDLDMMMPRSDYEKLLALLKDGCLRDNYSFRYPDGKNDAPISFLKVYKNDSLLINLTDGKDCPYPQKVFLDVFPLDGAPANRICRKVKGLVADALRLVANMVYDARPWTDAQEEFYSSIPEIRRTIMRRRFWGKILSLIPHRKWVYWFDCFVRNPDMNGLIGIPTGRKLYGGEIFKSEVYLPTVSGIFEGLEVPLPGNWDEYLRNLYHDYLILPPENKRERHFIVEMVLHDN